tara:strand:+ start:783 stop:989 length:207 start_codon:yes stop_codon:yes gene_type:complete
VKEIYNSRKSLMEMDWLLLAPMPVTKWWRKVSRIEHASLMNNGYIITIPYDDVWHVKITPKGKARLAQ